MLTVGILYVAYKALNDILSDGSQQANSKPDMMSTIIFGAQTGLVALAMIVTRSSVIKLKAREGLGSGNLYVGWFTLRKCSARIYCLRANECSGFSRPSIGVPASIKQALCPTADRHFPPICTHLHHPHHFIRRPFLLRFLRVPLQLDATRTQSLRSHINPA